MWTPAQIIPEERRTANSQVSIPSWLTCFNEDTLGSSGLEKEKNQFQYLAFTLNFPLEFMEAHTSTSLQFHTVPLVFCLYQWSLLCFMHQKNPPTKVKWKHCPSTRPCRNTTASYFCSYPWGLPKSPSWDHQTPDTRAKAPKGSFHYLGEGKIYCLSASRNLLLPPAFGLLPTSLISNSLKESILTCNTTPCSPHKKIRCKKNLLFWA